MEAVRKLGMDNAGNPVDDEDLTAGKPLGLVQHRDRFVHPGDPRQERYDRRVPSSQQTDRAQI